MNDKTSIAVLALLIIAALVAVVVMIGVRSDACREACGAFVVEDCGARGKVAACASPDGGVAATLIGHPVTP